MNGPILVVDDDPSIRDVIATVLEAEGYPVVEAGDGEQALEAISARKPSLLLLDLWMPDIDGWTVARILRQRGSGVPIIVMSADRDVRYWAQELGADACIPKPFDLSDLLAAVRRFWRRLPEPSVT